MSAGEAMLYLLVALTAIDAAAFAVLMLAVMVETTAEVLRVGWEDVVATIAAVLLVAFFVWFCMGMPVPGGEQLPQPILEGRHDD